MSRKQNKPRKPKVRPPCGSKMVRPSGEVVAVCAKPAGHRGLHGCTTESTTFPGLVWEQGWSDGFNPGAGVTWIKAGTEVLRG